MNTTIHKLVPIGIIGVSMLFFMAVFIWGILPLQNLITGKANAIEADRTLQANKESRIKELPQLKDTYDHILQNERVLDTLVNHDQVVPFIERVELLARDDGVEITITNQGKSDVKKKPDATGAGKPVNGQQTDETAKNTPSEKKKKDETILGNLPFDAFMSLRFDVRGRYANVLQFLQQIESLPYALSVVAMDIRQWEPAEKRVGGDVFSSGNEVGLDGAVPLEQPVEQPLVQAFFDAVVYTKD